MINNQNLLAARSNTYRLLLENEWVRVLEFRKNSGQISLVHKHSNVNVFYVYNDTKCKLRFPDGSGTVLEIKAQQTLCIEQSSINTKHFGKTQKRNLVIEMNNQDH
jgi:hypothetical protein